MRVLLAAGALAVSVAAALGVRATAAELPAGPGGLDAGLSGAAVVVCLGLSALLALAVPVGVVAWTVARRAWRLLLTYALTTAVTAAAAATVPLLPEEPRPPTRDTAALPAALVEDAAAVVAPGPLAAFAAALTVTGGRLPTRWRRWGWAVLGLVVVLRGLAVGAVPTGSAVGLAAGWFVGAVALLALGSPSSGPDPGAVTRALQARGLEVETLRPMPSSGSWGRTFGATTGDGERLVLRVFGRDDRRAQVLARLDRWATTRRPGDDHRFASLRRAVEHEGLVDLLADRAGVRTPALRAIVHLDDDAMVLVHVALDGTRLDALPAQQIDAALVHRLWTLLGALRAARLAHGDLQLTALIRTSDGGAAVDGFAAGQVSAADDELDRDVAQLLLSLAPVVDPHVVVAAAVATLGAPAVAAAAPLLQPAALPRRTRTHVARVPGLLDRVRHEVEQQTSTPPAQLAPLRRATGRTVVALVLVAVATYVLLPQLSELPVIAEQVRTADWRLAGLAAVFSALTYVGSAVALDCSIARRLPLGRFTLVQLACSFGDLVSPAGLGAYAINIRFLQRRGVPVADATGAVALQGSVQVLTHVALLSVFAWWAGRTVDLDEFVPRGTDVLVGVGVLLGLVGAALLVPRARRWVETTLRPQVGRTAHALVAVARQPARLSAIVVGAVLLTMSYVGALWASIGAFGGDQLVPFPSIAITFMVAATVASAAPTPGGVGAVEAAMIGSLTAFGLPAAVAVPAVFLYRLVTFWLPVLPGWVLLVWLRRTDQV